MFFTSIDSPFGEVMIAGDETALHRVDFQAGNQPIIPQPDWIPDARPLKAAAQQLRDYFAGRLTRFNLPLAPRGTTFRKKVWSQLTQLPYGEVISYRDLAVRVGNPKACRAVGAANGANPICIIIPCHRVICSDGRLTGYAGGISIKEGLLELERRGAGK